MAITAEQAEAQKTRTREAFAPFGVIYDITVIKIGKGFGLMVCYMPGMTLEAPQEGIINNVPIRTSVLMSEEGKSGLES